MPVLYVHPCPLPTPEQVAFVCLKLPMRGPEWARDYMERTGGYPAYPEFVRKRVEDDEQARLQLEVSADADES